MTLRTADQLAEVFNVESSTVRRWATKSRHHEPCPHEKDGRGRLRFDADLVDQWLQRTGVLKRSKAQARPKPVLIIDAIHWTPDDITTEADDCELHAVHRTIASCLFTCTNCDDLPDPPDLDLRTPKGRDTAIDFLLGLEPRLAEDWKLYGRQAIDTAGNAALMDAIYG